MSVTHLFAGISVAGYHSMQRWYERLFGRAPDVVPNEREAVWHLADSGSVYVVTDPGRAGNAVVTLIVGDLDVLLSGLIARGLEAPKIEEVAGAGRKALILDPEGNQITFAELR